MRDSRAFVFAFAVLWASLTSSCTRGLPYQIANQYHSAAIEKGASPSSIDFKDPVLTDLRTILLTTEINESSSREIIAKLLFLDALSDAPINLYISTYGGFIKDAFSVIDVIDSLKSPVNTIGMGACYSGGALLLAAGTGSRTAMPNTTIVIHSPTPEGKAEARLSELWLKINHDFLKRQTKLPPHLLPKTLDRKLVLTLNEAVEYELIDRISTPSRNAP